MYIHIHMEMQLERLWVRGAEFYVFSRCGRRKEGEREELHIGAVKRCQCTHYSERILVEVIGAGLCSWCRSSSRNSSSGGRRCRL